MHPERLSSPGDPTGDPTRELRVAVVGGPGRDVARLLAATGRVAVVPVTTGLGILGTARALRRVDPDVVLTTGDTAPDVARWALRLTGHHSVLLEDVVPAGAGSWGPEDPGRLVGALAEAAGRPGAALVPDRLPPVSVVVPVWCEGVLVEELVAALVPQLRPDDELVLVDDGSSDDTGERIERAAREHRQVTAVRQHPNAGAAAARNAGIARARHEHVVFTDAGCHWGPRWLDGIRAPFGEVEPPDLVAGSYTVSRRGPLEAAWAVGCYPDPADVRRAAPGTALWLRLFGRRFDPTRPAGRSMAVTRSAMDLVGGWPEHIRAHEDLDLARSIAERGLRCVQTADADLSWDQADLRGTVGMYVRYGRGDAEASDRQALVRDLVRAGAYVVALLVGARGGRSGQVVLAAGGAFYVSVPVARAAREERPVTTALLVPLVVAARDVAKAWGALSVLAQRGRVRAPRG